MPYLQSTTRGCISLWISVFKCTVFLTSFQMSQFIKVHRMLFPAQLSTIQLLQKCSTNHTILYQKISKSNVFSTKESSQRYLNTTSFNLKLSIVHVFKLTPAIQRAKSNSQGSVCLSVCLSLSLSLVALCPSVSLSVCLHSCPTHAGHPKQQFSIKGWFKRKFSQISKSNSKGTVDM